MPTNREQLNRIVSELQGDKVSLVCGKHRYVASKLPPKTSGCKMCWEAYYFYDYAKTLPHMRQERLDELETVIHHVVEYAEKGKFDFEPEQRVTHKFIRDGFDDKRGEYRDEKITIEE